VGIHTNNYISWCIKTCSWRAMLHRTHTSVAGNGNEKHHHEVNLVPCNHYRWQHSFINKEQDCRLYFQNVITMTGRMANIKPEPWLYIYHTAGRIAPKPMPRIEAANKNRCLPARFLIVKGRQPARSSRHAVSAMHPGVKTAVWRSDAISQVDLDML
jgi:hypothetical protein